MLMQHFLIYISKVNKLNMYEFITYVLFEKEKLNIL